MTSLRLSVRLLPLACFIMVGAPVGDAVEPGSIWFPRVSSAAGRPVPPRRVAPAAPDSTRTLKPHPAVLLNKIPLDILMQLSDVENVTYFLNTFVDSDTLAAHEFTDGAVELENRFGDAGDARKSIQSAKPALCKPELELVSLTMPSDPSMYFYPTCTRIERCGGCCGSDLLSCQPTDTEIVNVKVIVTQYTGNVQMAFKGHEIIPLERHTKCKCDCIIKETDCNQFQEYKKNECQCVCMNEDEQQKCMAENDIKDWDSSTCTCKCRQIKDCNSGNYYDQDTCKCTQIPALRNRRREVYSLGPIL